MVLGCLAKVLVAEMLHLRAGDRALGHQTQIRADFFGDLRVVPGGDFHLDVQRRQSGKGLAGGGFGFIGEHTESGQHQIGFVGSGDGGQLRSRLDRHRNHPPAGGEQPGQGLLGVQRYARAAGQHLLGCALAHQQPLAVVINQHRGRPPNMVERQHRHPLHPIADQLRGAWMRPQRGIQRVGRSPAGGRINVAGQQPQPQHRITVSPGGRDGVDQADAAFGQRSGLIGDQDVDVTQVLDAHQPFDQHLNLGQLPGAGRQAGADHRGQQLRGDAHRDGQREQRRRDQRPVQHQVGNQDKHDQRERHPQQQIRELPQTRLKVGLGCPVPQTRGDPAELGVFGGGVDHRQPFTGAHDGAHERHVAHIGQRHTSRHRRR